MGSFLEIIKKRRLYVVLLILVLLFGIILVPRTFASLQPVKSVEIFSKELDYVKDTPGGWKIKKSAKWISKGMAEITIDLDTILKKQGKPKDYVLVLDVSSSMAVERLDRVKTDTTELIGNLLASKDSEIGLITFSTESEIISDFTNDKNTLIDKVNNLIAKGTTNYYQALVNLDTLLKNSYRKNEECVVLFLTDGYPNEESPNEIWQYQYLKQEYPSLTINGIQYEMGKEILKPLKSISDNQYISDMKTLNNVLFDASVSSFVYDDFKITDYIDTDYFVVDGNEAIEVNSGSFDFDKKTQKITWTLDKTKSGLKAKMKIKAKLKDEFVNESSNYSTNKKLEVVDTIDGTKDGADSYLTPVLSNNYMVTYDGNAPSGCSLDGVPSEKEHFVFDVVEINNRRLVCDGYQFKGWDIVTENVEKINSDYFIVPEANVVLRAKWSRLDVKKAVSGKVSERTTLYEQVRTDASDSTKFVRKYTGNSSTFTGDKNVYYYYGDAKNNNVLFANYCWKIVRTTDTGGIKLLYNGVPAGDGSCNNSGSNSALTSDQMGISSSKSAFNSNNKSPGTAGYMYGSTYERYANSSKIQSYVIKYMSMKDSDEFYYTDSVTYSNTYSMYNVESKTLYNWGESKYDLVGKYTCAVGADKPYFDHIERVIYIVAVEEDRILGIPLTDGKLLDDYKMVVGTDVTNNGDGTFTLENTSVSQDANWYEDYNKYVGYYTCGTTETTCTDMMHIKETTSMSYKASVSYKFGRTFEYENGIYKVSDAEYYFSEDSDYQAIDERRYTCFDSTGQCGKLYYVYYTGEDDYFYLMILENGTSARNALDSMLYNPNVNTNNSNIKTVVDYWYQNNMVSYTKYLEDTIWCNNRYTMTNSWRDIAEAPSGHLAFKAGLTSDSLKCDYINDRFTVGEENGNGKLTYPVGLLTAYEISESFVNNKSSLASGNVFWTMSPLGFTNVTQVVCAQKSGNIATSFVSSELDVRPSISLKAGIRYGYGDGTDKNPYVVELES